MLLLLWRRHPDDIWPNHPLESNHNLTNPVDHRHGYYYLLYEQKLVTATKYWNWIFWHSLLVPLMGFTDRLSQFSSEILWISHGEDPGLSLWILPIQSCSSEPSKQSAVRSHILCRGIHSLLLHWNSSVVQFGYTEIESGYVQLLHIYLQSLFNLIKFTHIC